MAGVCTGPGPCDTHPTGHGGDNFVTRGGGFDPYLRAIINALKRKGHPESEAVQIAIGTVQRWARGEGNVTPETRARAAKSLAAWEALRAKAHADLAWVSMPGETAVPWQGGLIHTTNDLAAAKRNLMATVDLNDRAIAAYLIDLAADPVFATTDGPTLTEPVGGHMYHHGWIRIDAAAPTAVERAHAFRRKGLSESEAIQRAVGVVKNWAEGKGGVTAETRARAAAAVAEWEAKKTASHSLTAQPGAVVDLAEGTHVYHWKHGWIPITPAARVVDDAMKGASNSDMLTHLHTVAARNARTAKVMREKGMHDQARHHHDIAMAAGQMHRFIREGQVQDPGDFHAEQRRRLEVTRRTVPTAPNASGGTIDRVEAAARMFGRGSKQHKAAAKKSGVSLTAAPAAMVDLAADPVFATTDGPTLTEPVGGHRYHHGWIRIDAAAPTAVERATRAVSTDGHALLHGRGMVPTAQRVIERMKAAGHTPKVSRVNVNGTPHVHIARSGTTTSLTANPRDFHRGMDLAWSEQLHPRGGKGTAAGGKFVSKNATPAPAKGTANSLPANMAANVRDFQRRAGLPVTGVIDTVTAKKITAEATSKGGSGKKSGKSKAKHAAAAARKQISQHVTAVNALSPGQRAQYRAKIPTPPAGYVWGKNDTLHRAPNSGALRGVLATIGAKSVTPTPAATRTTGVGSGGQRTAKSLTRRRHH